ncbi:type IX secretion system membrane protein PorP/SprF [Limibacter armeniacum]|uniref:type IX secretion system membrane protein PorP/SprF n=1 Tax=Limibacter armeniacum TaxID=466084 RepID=UPI002FE68633
MKRSFLQGVLVCAFLALALGDVKSQQLSDTDNYLYSYYLVNPASYQENHSFTGVLYGNLQSLYNNSSLFKMGGGGVCYFNNFGVGLQYYHEKISQVSQTYLKATYAYRVNFRQNSGLTLGVAAGLYDQNVGLQNGDYDQIVDLSDPVLLDDRSSPQMKFIMSFGMTLRIQDLEIGASIPNIAFVDKSILHLARGYIDYKVKVSESVDLSPAVILEYDRISDLKYAGVAKFNWKNTLQLTTAYQSNKKVLLTTGVGLNGFTLMYTYIHHLEDFSTIIENAHEVALRFSKKSDKKPYTKYRQKVKRRHNRFRRRYKR